MRLRWVVLCLALCVSAAACKGKPHEHEEHKDHEHDEAGHDEEGHDEEGHNEEERGHVVKVSTAAMERLGIRTDEVKMGVVRDVVEVPAEVRLDPDRTAQVAPLVAGQIAEVFAKLGDHVEEGDQLVVLRSVDVGEARAATVRARAALGIAQDELARQEQLRDAGVGAERNYVQAQGVVKRAKADLVAALSRVNVIGGARGSGASMVIVSPLGGTIIQRRATQGELASPDSALFVVSDLSRVWVIGAVYEQHVALAREGNPAVLELRAYPGRRWEGEIRFVADQLDERTRTVEVRVELDNPDGELRPGLFGRLSLPPPDAQPAVVVPDAALQEVDGVPHVFVAGDSPGEFHAVGVGVGARGGGQAEIVSSLSPGTRIAVSGTFELKSVLLSSRLGHGHAH